MDDLVVLEQVLKNGFNEIGTFTSEWQSKDRLRLVNEAYAKVGLKNNPKKGFLGSLLRFLGH